ncbi:H-NS histone family protein [Comamonas sp. JUb58]|uniref:H-NS histone family protein n=1 Tax=Comamonas sp. JUb58 TaxID=2485114 RepID=UPI00105E076B|nr:H-NS histone family protein [Comamonas sp. JUb58]TDS70821.1 DNA-binding protein H-NS [Comamonas sp. JUb58]
MATSLSDIQAKIAALQEQEAKLIESEKDEVIQQLKEKISAYKITFEELGFVAPVVYVAPKNKAEKKEPAEAKYRDPATGATWSGGRGKRPAWVASLVEQWEKNGKKYEDEIQNYLINK